MHGLAAELAGEPQCAQVEVAVDKAVETELGLAVFAGLVVHDFLAVGAVKLWNMYHGNHYILVTDSPYFYIALTTMILGCQLFLAGFIGELIARNAQNRNHYEIETEL